MANLNLSEFTEKTFVADADWTFVWDTAGLISKKVSRNSLLNSGTLTADAPVTISQTWNGTGSTVFTALKVDAIGTGSTSSALSNLLDLQTSGVSQLKLGQGFITFSNTSATVPASGFCMGVAGGQYMLLRAGSSSHQFTFSATGLSFDNVDHAIFFGGGVATAPRLYRDADRTLALRNGTNAQTFNVYGTFTTATTNFERLAIKYNATDFAYQIAAEKGTTNGDYRPLDFVTGGSRRMTIGTTGNVGIGTTAPSSKLQVTGGDVEIETVTSGIIMKAAGTSTRYRITLNAGGTALVFTAI